MKGWAKRGIVMILILALAASQMFGCRKNKESLSNENQNTEENVDNTGNDETNPVDPVEWLKEELENIQESVLKGDYAQIAELLLEMQDQLADNELYNVWLYIVYMGMGNESAAEALLNNPNLDIDAFTDAFLESMDALKGNKDMEAIERKLMEHMLKLGESNSEAYEAVARIGANIQNSNPEDPTIYAIRYIAALAAGDKTAAKAILAEAEANGISAEALQTTAIDYIEEHNLTVVSVEEIEKGKTTSTTYNTSGDVVKSEVTVDNKDGTETRYISNSSGSVLGEALYNKATGEMIQKTIYLINRNTDSITGDVTELLSGEKDVYEYENGVLKSMTGYNADGSKNFYITLSPKGEVTFASGYRNGQEIAYSAEQMKITDLKVEDGNLVFRSIPEIDGEGNVIGKRETTYEYINPMGLPTKITQYEYDKESGFSKVREIEVAYDYNGNAKADYETMTSTNYTNGMKSTYEYKENVLLKVTIVTYDEYFKEVVGTYVEDYINHTEQQYSKETNGFVYRVLDETNTYKIREYHYEGTSADGVLLGIIFFEFIVEDGTVITSTRSKSIEYKDDDENNTKTTIQTEYDIDGNVVKTTGLEYDKDSGELLRTEIRDYVNHTLQMCFDGYFHDVALDETNTLWLTQNVYEGDNADGILNKKYFYAYDGMKQISEKRVFYDKAGNVTREEFAEFVDEDGVVIRNISSKIITYTYDDEGNMQLEVQTVYDIDGDTLYRQITDYVNHTMQKNDGYILYDSVLDETNTYILTTTIYLGDGYIFGVPDSKIFYSYEGTKLISEVHVQYDDSENIIKEEFYEHIGEDGAVIKSVPSKTILYEYDEANNKRTEIQDEYDRLGNETITTEIDYDSFGNIIYKGVLDYVNHTMTEEEFDNYLYENVIKNTVFDESNRYMLVQTVYRTDGTLYAKYFGYYEGTTQIGELDVFYDESGRVILENIYEDGLITLGYESKVVTYTYGSHTVTRDEMNWNTFESTSRTDYYDNDGKLIKTEYTDADFNYTVENYTYDADGKLVGSVVTDLFDTEMVIRQTEYIYKDGMRTVIIKDADGNILSKEVTEYTYGANGEITSETVYQVGENDSREENVVKEYIYDENGIMTGYIISEKDADGNVKKTYYTPEGYAYQNAIYDTNGQILMSMSLELEESEIVEFETAEAEEVIENEIAEDVEFEAVEIEIAENESEEEETAETEIIEEETTGDEIIETEVIEAEIIKAEFADDEMSEDESTGGDDTGDDDTDIEEPVEE